MKQKSLEKKRVMKNTNSAGRILNLIPFSILVVDMLQNLEARFGKLHQSQDL